MSERKYFKACEGGSVDYWIVATSLADALRMLADREPEGDEIEIVEIDGQRAAAVTVHDGDPSSKFPLSTADVGSLFSSEW